MSQFTGGSTIDLGGNFSVGASLYDDLPLGSQKDVQQIGGQELDLCGRNWHAWTRIRACGGDLSHEAHKAKPAAKRLAAKIALIAGDREELVRPSHCASRNHFPGDRLGNREQ